MIEEFSNIPGNDPAREDWKGEATLPASPVRDLLREVHRLQAGEQDADNLIKIAARLAEEPHDASADEVALKIINAVEQKRRPAAPHLLSAIIEVTREFGEFEECQSAAETLCRYAMKQARLIGDSCLLLTASLELGDLCLMTGRPAEAQEHIRRGLDLLERNFHSHPRLALKPLAQLLEAHLELGEVEEARRCDQRISRLLKGRVQEIDQSVVDAHSAQARLHQYEGDNEAALGRYETLLKAMELKHVCLPYETAELLLESSGLLHSSGRYDEAETQLRTAIAELLDRQPCGGENLLSEVFRSLEDTLLAQGKFGEVDEVRRLFELYGGSIEG